MTDCSNRPLKTATLIIYFLGMVLSILPGKATADELFPVPSALKPNVEFWTKIYSLYSSNHAVIHDSEDLTVIYQVIDLNNFFQPDVDLKTKWKKVEELKDEYRDVLASLATMPAPVRLESLNDLQRHVYILWSHSDDPEKFQKARQNIRGQLGLRDRFITSLQRSGAIVDHIKDMLEQYDLPADLVYLPHVESLYDYKSYSKVGAVGLWQFIRHTGRLFLTINYAIDERRDPYFSTEAAAKLLKLNMDELQSWPLAITAYNHGLTGIKKAVQETGTRDFGTIFRSYKSRTFGFASKNFYAEFLAARQVAKEYKSYFGEIKIQKAKQFQTVRLPASAYLNQLARDFDLPVDTLVSYNPALKWSVVSNRYKVPKDYELRLPMREGFDPREVIVRLTPLAPPQRGLLPIEQTLLTFHSRPADTTRSMSEEEVFELLKRPVPSMLQKSSSATNDMADSGM